MLNLPTYNQGAAAWRDKSLGSSGLKMAGFGCYTTVASAILASYMKLGPTGNPLTPSDLCDLLNANNGFDSGGQLQWNAIKQLFPDCALLRSCWTTNVATANEQKTTIEKAIDDIKRWVRMGFPVGICVDLVGGDKLPDHIVACKYAPDDLSKWQIMDPNGGKDMIFQSLYGSPLTGVMGYRLLAGPPVSFPENSVASDQRAGGAVAKCLDQRYTKKDVLDHIIGS